MSPMVMIVNLSDLLKTEDIVMKHVAIFDQCQFQSNSLS